MDLQNALKQHFGFEDFRQGQESVIRHVLDGRDVILVMPTGSGKSLCYQLPAMLLDGVTVIVSPLIALMKDQVDGLLDRNLPATFINSSLSASEVGERMNGLRTGRFKMLYVAPERFKNRHFLAGFDALSLSLFAIDEAHCISQWGHDFRPDYLRLKEVILHRPLVPVMALTATATPEVREDIIQQLGLGLGLRQGPDLLVHGFARPNLRLVVSRTSSRMEKLDHVQAALREYKTGIVYCATRKHTEEVGELLSQAGTACPVYHAGLPDEERKRIQDLFMEGGAPVVAATNAFGMGVDRSDLRFVIHWDIPGSLEAYYQEIGRAGRDGQESLCQLLYSHADVRTQEYFIQGANPSRQDIEACWRLVRSECEKGPVLRSLEEWAELVFPGGNEMSCRTALSILDNAGLIVRERTSSKMAYATSLVPDADPEALTLQMESLEGKKARDERKLKRMQRYAHTQDCRHAFILRYFGDPDVSGSCTACDTCLREVRSEEVQPLTEEHWIMIQQVLSGIARLRGRLGCARAAQVLAGSRSQFILDRGLDGLPTYGALRAHGESFARSLIEELIKDGSVQVSGDEYPVVRLTDRGQAVMRREETPLLAWPKSKMRWKDERIEKPRRSVGKGPEDLEGPEPDSVLVESMKVWRRGEAAARGVPPYIILHDTTLKSIAAAAPRTVEELLKVSGMGPYKVKHYGEDLLRLIQEWDVSKSSGGGPAG